MYAEERAPTIVTINSHVKAVVRRLAFLSLAVLLLSAACGEKPSAKMEAHRLGRPEILEWLAAGFRTGKPIEFMSREGRGCCDVGDTRFVFHPDQTIHILREHFVGTEFNVPYNISVDGKITVVPTDNKERADDLLSEDIHDFYLFRYGCQAQIPLGNDIAGLGLRFPLADGRDRLTRVDCGSSDDTGGRAEAIRPSSAGSGPAVKRNRRPEAVIPGPETPD